MPLEEQFHEWLSECPVSVTDIQDNSLDGYVGYAVDFEIIKKPHKDVIFNFGGTSKEVNLKDINSVDDIASNMKEVIKKEKESKEKSNG